MDMESDDDVVQKAGNSEPMIIQSHSFIHDLVHSRRWTHEMHPGFFAQSRLMSVREGTLDVLTSLTARRSIVVVVTAYLILAIVALLLDLGAVCINGQHVKVERDEIHKVKRLPPMPLERGIPIGSFLTRRGRLEKNYLHLDEQELHAEYFEIAQEPKHERVVICEPLYAHQAHIVSKVIGATCLCLSTFLVLEHALRMWSITPGYFLDDRLLTVDFVFVAIAWLSDILIILVFRPYIEKAFRLGHNADAVMWLLFSCRLLRLGLMWRVLCALFTDLSDGEEVVRTLEAIQMMTGSMSSMPQAVIRNVEIIRNPPAEVMAYHVRFKSMRHRYAKTKDQLLFVGSADRSPHTIAENHEGIEKNLFSALGKDAIYLAERAAYMDSCYAFTDWEADPSGKTRQLLVASALLGKVREEAKDKEQGGMMIGHLASRPMSGNDCVCIGPCWPREYTPEDLELQRRDVASRIFAFHEPRGQLLPVAIITYENEAAFQEIETLKTVGAKSWLEFLQGPKHTKEQADALQDLARAIDDGHADTIDNAMHRCLNLAVPEKHIASLKQEIKNESEDAGISLAYILSAEFRDLAQRATGVEDPTFYEMSKPFWREGDHRIGESRLCPRDLKPGCSMLDSLPRQYRGKANAFLSWVWRYKLSIVCSGLRRWADAQMLRYEEVFLFVCFFCNNQWRILVEGSMQGSDDLEVVFENRLKKIGRVVAVMDNWDNPLYLTRIWTIFEQYIASTIDDVVLHFALPDEPTSTLITEVDKGREGITRVIQAVSIVDAENAQASFPDDEKKVKNLIRNSQGGFARVNERVKHSIVEWIAQEFRRHVDTLVLASSS